MEIDARIAALAEEQRRLLDQIDQIIAAGKQAAAEVRVQFYGQCHSCGYPLDVNGMCTAPLQGDD